MLEAIKSLISKLTASHTYHIVIWLLLVSVRFFACQQQSSL